jgi:hypothetical protein
MAQSTVAWPMTKEHRANRKTAAPIQIVMAAFFSEIIGVGFITKDNRAANIRFPIA